MADQSEKKLRTPDDEVNGGDGEAVSVKLPVDIITEILVRLPLTTLLQFKCVSKPWRSLIADPSFANSFLARFLARPVVTTLVCICQPLGPSGSLRRFFSLDHQTGISTYIPLPDMPYGPHGVSGSINGFICLNDGDLTHLVNPSTREIASLPLTGPDFPADLQGKIESFSALGYDPASKQYKVLKTWILFVNSGGVFATHKVLTLGTNSWRIVDDCPIKSPWEDCISAEGAIHIQTYNLMEKNIVVTFDVASEKFRMLLPPGVAEARTSKVDLKLFREHLALLDCQRLWDDDTITMYILDDYGSQAWKELRMVLPHSWKEGIEYCISLSTSITRNDDILLIPMPIVSQSGAYLVSYNVESKRMKKVQIHGLVPIHRSKYPLYGCELFDFVDSILSLNHLNS